MYAQNRGRRCRRAAGMSAIVWALATASLAQDTLWETYINEAGAAEQHAQYDKALRLYKLALEEAEKFGPTDQRLATSLNNLAELYRTQGDYARAEPLCKRSLAITEKALGPDHPDVATSLENYAALLRETKREAEAKEFEKRAAAIRAKRR